jgi:hypothetical protein
MKLSILLTTTLFATVLTTRAVPTVYLTLGDDIPQYHAFSGNFLGNLGTFPGVNISGDSSELTVGPDGALYSIGSGGIWRTDIETATSSPFVVFGEEVQVQPGGIAFADDGFLYVTSGDNLLRYDASTGAFVGVVGSFPGFSFGSFSDDLTFGPDGALYTLGPSPRGGAIWRTDIETATSSPFVIFGSGQLTAAPGGFVFVDGSIYVSSADRLLEYDAETGALIGEVGTFPGAFAGSFLDNLVLGQDGMIYSQGPSGIWRININSGTATEIIDLETRASGFVILLP